MQIRPEPTVHIRCSHILIVVEGLESICTVPKFSHLRASHLDTLANVQQNGGNFDLRKLGLNELSHVSLTAIIVFL